MSALRSFVRMRPAVWIALAMSCSCGGQRERPRASEPREVTVHIRIADPRPGLSQATEVSLAAAKQGRATIGSASAGEVEGAHTFPLGTTAVAIAGYFGPLLRRAGWDEADFTIENATITFRGVDRVSLEASHEQLTLEIREN